jgi:hypothetical protein
MKKSALFINIILFVGFISCQNSTGSKSEDASNSQDSVKKKTDSSGVSARDNQSHTMPPSDAHTGNESGYQSKDSLSHSSNKVSPNFGSDQNKLDSIKRAKDKLKNK